MQCALMKSSIFSPLGETLIICFCLVSVNIYLAQKLLSTCGSVDLAQEINKKMSHTYKSNNVIVP